VRIGVNLLYLIPGVVGGTETYAAGLLRGLAAMNLPDEFLVFVNRESADWPLPRAGNFTRVVCAVSATNRAARYFFEQFRLPRLLKVHAVELVHSLGYVSPLFPACPSVVTIPDLNYRAFGRAMPVHRRWALAFLVRQSARRSRHVVTISEFSRKQILCAFGVDPRKVTVTLLACDSEAAAPGPAAGEIRARLGIRTPYIIAFSSSSPHKNIPRLLEAFTRAKLRHSFPHQLVLVGHPPSDADLNSVPETSGLDSVLFTGYLNEISLRTVLAGAELVAVPSIYEGFGLPVLEAMAAHVPVVSSRVASLPEVAGEGALYFDPFSVQDMADKLATLLLDPGLRGALRDKGIENLRRFSWEGTAAQTLEVYRSVVGSGASHQHLPAGHPSSRGSADPPDVRHEKEDLVG
jgi:glycosyltransferase involved in cell wall biosynthesis